MGDQLWGRFSSLRGFSFLPIVKRDFGHYHEADERRAWRLVEARRSSEREALVLPGASPLFPLIDAGRKRAASPASLGRRAAGQCIGGDVARQGNPRSPGSGGALPTRSIYPRRSFAPPEPYQSPTRPYADTLPYEPSAHSLSAKPFLRGTSARMASICSMRYFASRATPENRPEPQVYCQGNPRK